MNASDVVARLRERYSPERRYLVLEQVALHTGWGPSLVDATNATRLPPEQRRRVELARNRRLDVVVVPFWPSDCGKQTVGERGQWVHRAPGLWGFEVKVDRGDWNRERKNPEKAAQWLDACQRFYFVSAPGVIKWGEVDDAFPAAGWLEWQAKASRFVEHRKPTINESAEAPLAVSLARAAYQAGRNGR